MFSRKKKQRCAAAHKACSSHSAHYVLHAEGPQLFDLFSLFHASGERWGVAGANDGYLGNGLRHKVHSKCGRGKSQEELLSLSETNG